MADQKRQYQMRRRAELEAQTRLRITESAMELHGTLGPSRTTVSAIAERAGVRRSTVYRHFPDEASLFAACSAHWDELNPPPALGAWAEIEDPDDRLARALRELYAFYARSEQMLANLHRDEETVPLVAELFGPFHGFLDAASDLVVAGRPERGAARRRVRAAVGHALAFTTWRSLVRGQGLSGERAAELMRRLVASAAA